MRTDSSSSGGGGGNTIPLWMNSGFDARVDGSDVASGGTWNLGQWYDIAIISNSSGFTVYANNQSQTSGAAVSSTALEQYLVIGNPAGGGGLSAGDFEIMHCLFANRAWSINELRAFSNNPWQIFEDPFSSFFYTGAGGGGNEYTIVPSGGFTLSGTAPNIRERVQVPSGGIQFSGAVPLLRERVLVPSGGVVFSGTAPITFNAPNIYTITPSGGVNFSGSAALLREKIFVPSGGITLSGTAPLIRERIQVPSGGVVFSGSSPIIFIPAGGVVATNENRISVGLNRSCRIS